MRADALALGVLLAATTGAIRADDLPDLTGSWTLASVTLGRDQRPFLDHVLTVRQAGPVVTMETVVNGGPPRIATFTIGDRKATTDQYGVARKARVEKRALIIEEKSLRRGLDEDFFGRTFYEERTQDLETPRFRKMGINVNPVRRVMYRVSDDGMTLEVRKPGDLRWVFKRQ